jgi:hypothetical protein
LIIFDLKCAAQSHVFEAWFGSTSDYDDQQARGLVSCPICGSSDVVKAPMAPAVGTKGNRATAPEQQPGVPMAAADPHKIKAMLAAAAAVQKTLLAGSEAVGDRFATEARAIHLGEADARPIHGRATPEQAASLAEDGIAFAPLPFPVPDPGEEN